MGLNNNENNGQGNGGVNVGAEGTAHTFTSNETPNDAGSVLGFGSRDIHILNSNQGSEYTNGLAIEMREAFAKLPAQTRPKINVLDKEVISGLAYSAIVASYKGTGETVSYYIVLLEATGRESMKASEISNEVANFARNRMNQNQRLNVWTTDDAVDQIMHEEAIRTLAKEWGEVEFISVEGVVVPKVHGENKHLALKLASLSYNAVTVDAAISGNEIKDLNIAIALSKQPNSTLRIDSNLLKQTVVNEVDKPVRQDFSVELNLQNNSNNFTSINSQDARDKLVKVSGFLDAIPEEVPVPTMAGMPAVSNIRLHPNIIINSNAVKVPTTGYMLLGVITASVMANQNMWLTMTMPKDANDIHNAGALNILTNLEQEQNKVGKSLAGDLTGKKLNPEQAYGILRQMYTLNPTISYDIESFGPQTAYSSILAVAASAGNSENKIAAAKEIIETAHWLTNGAFPANYPMNEIFVSSGVMTPLGTWADKSGERDIRDVDLAMIANHTADVTLLNEWTLSNLPKEQSGRDPFLTRCDIINKLIPDAEINGKAIRVTFHANFIDTLVKASQAAGLDATYEPTVVFQAQHDIGIIGSHFASAGIAANAGFARQASAGGQNYSMGNSHMGYNRF